MSRRRTLYKPVPCALVFCLASLPPAACGGLWGFRWVVALILGLLRNTLRLAIHAGGDQAQPTHTLGFAVKSKSSRGRTECRPSNHSGNRARVLIVCIKSHRGRGRPNPPPWTWLEDRRIEPPPSFLPHSSIFSDYGAGLAKRSKARCSQKSTSDHANNPCSVGCCRCANLRCWLASLLRPFVLLLSRYHTALHVWKSVYSASGGCYSDSPFVRTVSARN
jgi:hypothetical protein